MVFDVQNVHSLFRHHIVGQKQGKIDLTGSYILCTIYTEIFNLSTAQFIVVDARQLQYVHRLTLKLYDPPFPGLCSQLTLELLLLFGHPDQP